MFHVSGDALSIASFNTETPLLSGWEQGGKFLKGTSVIAQQNIGRGHLILFGFRPQYRAISEVNYKFPFNALLYSASQPEAINGHAINPQPAKLRIKADKGGE